MDQAYRLTLLELFLSTPSARRATYALMRPAWVVPLFLSTPSARRATSHKEVLEQFHLISIHALREEGDLVCEELRRRMFDISIHALREEGDRKSEST